MRIKKIFSGHSTKAIFFFNGWGMDENAIKHLASPKGMDGYMFHQYNQIHALPNKLKEYTSVTVVAWSLGVWAAAKLLASEAVPVSKSVAFNGTERPIDDRYGIPATVFKGTLKNWNAHNRDKFMRRIFGGTQDSTYDPAYVPDTTTLDQQEELSALYHHITSQPAPTFQWDHAVIGKNDLVFSAHNQINYWKERCSYTLKDIPHFPFAGYASWDELITKQ